MSSSSNSTVYYDYGYKKNIMKYNIPTNFKISQMMIYIVLLRNYLLIKN